MTNYPNFFKIGISVIGTYLEFDDWNLVLYI